MKNNLRCFPFCLFVLTMLGRSFAQTDAPVAVIKIGEQQWSVQNLNVANFRNGDPIPQALSFAEWKKAGEAGKSAFCFFENKNSNGKFYGRLYNWYAVNDPRGLAPEGWHVATDEEWGALMENFDASQLRSGSGWAEDGNGNNESGLTILPAGERGFVDDYQDGFLNLGYIGSYWTATASEADYAWSLIFRGGSPRVSRRGIDKGEGMSVRCIKN